MTTDADDHTRIRLEELLAAVRTTDGPLIEPLSLEPAIRNIEETLEAYEQLDSSAVSPEDVR
ncbi:hypothetical protein [Natrinema halophilum]|uniref:Uncharacterized protein n=1 Tax=Natrinema halophilum TaxID=1699371 RepID=A0A7D5KB87_9EURY|nr:hypothetical protein [Natrinema halophilum]QLG47561.1 hypothetical protein HYG82_01210 [Natrinema halophilum]